MTDDAVTAGAFGGIQCLIGRFEDFFRIAMLGKTLGHTNADRHRYR